MNWDSPRPLFIDATFFLGMHDVNPQRRALSVSVFIEQLAEDICMSLEQVGLCDDIIWHRSRQEQDSYYPFMDNLHSIMAIQRLGFSRADVRGAMESPLLQSLPFQQACVLSQVINHNGMLYSHDPLLASHPGVAPWMACGPTAVENRWPTPLDTLYQQSLDLKLSLQESRYV